MARSCPCVQIALSYIIQLTPKRQEPILFRWVCWNELVRLLATMESMTDGLYAQQFLQFVKYRVF